MKKWFAVLFFLTFVIGSGYVLFNFWPYIFARTVDGVIADVQKVAPPSMIVGGGMSEATSRELFSFAVAIREKSGEIVTASSEDRQWAVAKPGQCATAKYYPYPPWEFEKSGTYFKARLLKLHVCDSGTLVTEKAAEAEAGPPSVNAQPDSSPTEGSQAADQPGPSVAPEAADENVQ